MFNKPKIRLLSNNSKVYLPPIQYPTMQFDGSDLIPLLRGGRSDSTSNPAHWAFQALDTTLRLRINGVAATIKVGGGDVQPFFVSVDGGSQVNPVISGGKITLFTGLSDGFHLVDIRVNPGYLPSFAWITIAADTLEVAGSDPSFSQDPNYGPFRIAQAEDDGTRSLFFTDNVNTDYFGGSPDAIRSYGSDSFRVRGTAPVGKPIWAFFNNGSVILSIDGAHGSQVSNSSGIFKWVQVGTGDGTEHEYTVIASSNTTLDGIMLGGAASFNDLPLFNRNYILAIGDSVTGATACLGGLTTLNSWSVKIGNSLDCDVANRGVDGFTTAAALTASSAIISSVQVDPTLIVIFLGYNDVGGAATDPTDYTDLLDNYLAAFDCPIVPLLIPRFGGIYDDQNTRTIAAIAACSDASRVTAGDISDLIYDDCNGTPGGDLHAGDVGQAQIAAAIMPIVEEALQPLAIFSDNFNRANSSLGGVGNGWIDTDSKWQISSNAALAPAFTLFDSGYLSRPVEYPSDIAISGKIHRPGTGNNGPVIWIRASHDDGNGYVWYFNGNGRIWVNRIDDGSTSVVGTFADTDLTGTDYEYLFSVRDKYICLSMYDVGGITANDPPLYTTSIRDGADNPIFYPSGTVMASPLDNGVSMDFINITELSYTSFLIANGDSITDGQGNQWGGWVGGALQILGNEWTGVSTAVSNKTAATILSEFSTVDAPVIAAAAALYDKVVYVLSAGTNDIFFNTSASDLQDIYEAIVPLAFTAGATNVVLCTQMYRNDFPSTSTLPGTPTDQFNEFVARIDVSNQWIRDNAFRLNVSVSDWATTTNMTDPNDTDIFPDKVHPNALGENYLSFPTAAAILASPDTVFVDYFNRADSSLGGVGNGWTDPDSAWQISGNELVAPGTGFFTHPIYRNLGINYADGRSYCLRANNISYNGTVTPFAWVRSNVGITQGLALWASTTSLSISWGGGGGQTATFSSYDYTAPPGVSTALDMAIWVQGDTSTLALYLPGEPSPFAAYTNDPRGSANNGGPPVNYSDAYYTNTQIAFSPFISPNVIDSCVVTAQTPANYVYYIGDSITCHGVPGVSASILGLNYLPFNRGIPSKLASQILTDFGTQNAPEIAAAKVAGKTVIVAFTCGTNDIASNATANDLITTMTNLISDAKTAGANKVIVHTQLYRAGGFSNGQNEAGFTTQIDIYNAWVLDNQMTLGYKAADWNQTAGMTDPTDLTTFDNDGGIHPNGLGTYLIATTTSRAIQDESPIVLFRDVPDRADSSPGGVGNGWYDPTTSWQISSNTFLATTSDYATKWLTQTGITYPTDFRVRFTVSNFSGAPIMLIRSDETAHSGYGFYIDPLGGGNFVCHFAPWASGAPGGTTRDYSTSLDSEIDVELLCRENTLTASVFEAGGGTDALVRVGYVDNTYATGKFTVSSFYNNNYFKNVSISTAPGINYRFVVLGDSISAGLAVSVTNWPVGVAHELNCYNDNWAHSGWTIGDLIASHDSEWGPSVTDSAQPCDVVIFAGTNEFAQSGASVDTAYASAVTLIELAQSSGARQVYYCTIINRTGLLVSGISAAEFAARQADFNGRLVTNATSLGIIVIDTQSIPQLADTTDLEYFSSDQTHPTTKAEQFYMSPFIKNTMAENLP